MSTVFPCPFSSGCLKEKKRSTHKAKKNTKKEKTKGKAPNRILLVTPNKEIQLLLSKLYSAGSFPPLRQGQNSLLALSYSHHYYFEPSAHPPPLPFIFQEKAASSRSKQIKLIQVAPFSEQTFFHLFLISIDPKNGFKVQKGQEDANHLITWLILEQMFHSHHTERSDTFIHLNPSNANIMIPKILKGLP